MLIETIAAIMGVMKFQSVIWAVNVLENDIINGDLYCDNITLGGSTFNYYILCNMIRETTYMMTILYNESNSMLR